MVCVTLAPRFKPFSTSDCKTNHSSNARFQLPLAPGRERNVGCNPCVSPNVWVTLPLHMAIPMFLPLLPPAVPGGDLTSRQTPGWFEGRAREVRYREECYLPDVVGNAQECGGFVFVHEVQCS